MIIGWIVVSQLVCLQQLWYWYIDKSWIVRRSSKKARNVIHTKNVTLSWMLVIMLYYIPFIEFMLVARARFIVGCRCVLFLFGCACIFVFFPVDWHMFLVFSLFYYFTHNFFPLSTMNACECISSTDIFHVFVWQFTIF